MPAYLPVDRVATPTRALRAGIVLVTNSPRETIISPTRRITLVPTNITATTAAKKPTVTRGDIPPPCAHELVSKTAHGPMSMKASVGTRTTVARFRLMKIMANQLLAATRDEAPHLVYDGRPL